MSRILIVEDEAQLASLIAAQLGAAGHSVTVVGDGLEALRSFESGTPDLVILDWMLPGASTDSKFAVEFGHAASCRYSCLRLGQKRSIACWVWRSAPTIT